MFVAPAETEQSQQRTTIQAMNIPQRQSQTSYSVFYETVQE
jgi:hypothetical protein